MANIILDAVLVIFLPKEYKLAGAATATALAQVVGDLCLRVACHKVVFAQKGSTEK